MSQRDRRIYFGCFARFFRTDIGRTDGYTRDRLKLQILNKKRLRCAPAQKYPHPSRKKSFILANSGDLNGKHSRNLEPLEKTPLQFEGRG